MQEEVTIDPSCRSRPPLCRAHAAGPLMAPLPMVMIEPAVRAALLEDLGRAGDLTTDAIVPAGRPAPPLSRDSRRRRRARFRRSRFRLIDPAIEIDRRVAGRQPVASRRYDRDHQPAARGILTAERTALNFLCHLSGVASATRGIADAIAGTRAQVCCTRKTMPGLRFAQKYAVRVGGGSNHRFGLDDAVLIKDNHVAIAGGVRPAVERARSGVGHLVKIEFEVDTLAQLQEALTLEVDAVLLDNMGPICCGRRSRWSMAEQSPRPLGVSARHGPGHRSERGRSAVGRLADPLRHRAGYRLGLVGPRLVLLRRKTPRPFRLEFLLPRRPPDNRGSYSSSRLSV